MKLTTSNQYWIITKIIEERKNKMNQELNIKELLDLIKKFKKVRKMI